VAVIALSSLLGYLGKSGSKVNTSEVGDTRVRVPGTFQPVLQIPYPFFSFYSVFQNALVPVNSFIIDIAVTFAAANVNDIIALGPGYWDMTLNMTLEEQGAVSDATSLCAVSFFALDGTGATVKLVEITNKQGLDQSFQLNWKQLVTSDQPYQFRLTRVAGLGTGLNIARLLIVGVRMF
jgi:hypothetical protein